MATPTFFTDSGTGNFVAKVQQWAMMPSIQQLWQDSDVIQLLDDEFVNTVVPLIKSTNEEYFVTTYDVPITSTWNGQVPFPDDAIGLDLRDVWAITGDPYQNPSGAGYAECRRFDPDQIFPALAWNNNNAGWNNGWYGPPYYVQNNVLMFNVNGATPANPYSFNFLRIRYFKKPNHLTSRANCAVITAIDTNLNTITTDNSNTSAAFYSGQSLDFITPQVPFMFDNAAITNTSVSVGTTFTTIGLPAGVAATLTVGDLVCPQGFAPVAQYIPEEAYNVLCQNAVCRIRDTQGDSDGYQRAEAKLQTFSNALLNVITPKIQDAPKKIVNTNNIMSASYSYSGAMFARS